MKNQKTLFVWLCTACLLLAIPAHAQTKGSKVTLSCSDMPLPTALRQVEKQSGYYKINFNQDDVRRYKVTATIKNATAEEAVRKLIANLPFAASINGRYIQVKRTEKATDIPTGRKTVHGKIYDSSGEPLIGATVLVDGTSKGAITDADGNFRLDDVEEGAMITYSYIGKQSLKRKATYKQVVIILEDQSVMFDDIVVTGYQTISKERTTGSFDKINAKDLEARPTADLSSALQGMVAGMQATENSDGTVSFAIRGQSTLYADAQPLVVVDGFPIEGSFSTINPNDVESVTVLKDAAAASIWGTRSANGVIVVTTKKSHDKKLKVQGKAFWRINTNPDLDYILNQADSKSAVDYEILANQKGWTTITTYTGDPSKFYGGGLSQAQELYYRNKYFGLSDSEMKAGLDELRNRNNRQQLKDYLMQTALLQQYNVSLQGGSDRLSNYVSLMYEKNDERTIKRGYNRFMLNYNNEYKFNKYITGTVGATLQKRSQDHSGVTVQDFSSLAPYDMIKNADGSYAYEPTIYDRLVIDQINTASFPYNDFSYNMLQEVENRNYKTTTANYRVQLGLNVKLLKGLTYDVKYQYERNETDDMQYDGEETFYVRNRVNYFTQYDTNTRTVTTSYIPKGGIKRATSGVNFNDVFRNQLSYSEIFGKHDITAIAGIEMSRYVTRSTQYPTVYGFNPETNTSAIPYYGQNTRVMSIDGSYYSNSEYQNTLLTVYNDREDRYLSYYGNVGYMYDDRYGASFSIRSDGSNFVSEDASLRWSPMWSVGVKWNLRKESFMKDLKWMNRLSLRATYGLNGNAEKSTSPQTLINTSTSSVVRGTIASVASLGNPLLKWERTKTFNIGADFSLFNNMLSGKIDYYNRKSIDVIGDVRVPQVYGTSTQRFNNAEISNKGIELELTGNFAIRSIGMDIRSTITYAYNKNEITKLYNPALYCSQLVNPSTFIEGKSIGSFYSYVFAGTENGDPYVYGVDGQKVVMSNIELHNRTLGKDVLDYSGTTIAPHTLGWNSQVNWRGFQLSVYITGKLGGKFRNPVSSLPQLGAGRPFIPASVTLFAESDGTLYPTYPKDNDTNIYIWANYLPNLTYFVESADFLKLKELNLSYNLPAKLVRKVNVQGASFFIQARDLGCIWTANKYDYDPEWLPGTNKPTASITFGLNVNL